MLEKFLRMPLAVIVLSLRLTAGGEHKQVDQPRVTHWKFLVGTPRDLQSATYCAPTLP